MKAADGDPLALELLARGLPIHLIVRGASMRPFVQDGDAVVISPDVARVGVGDVVLAPGEGLGVVHRVVARWGDRVWVKGDALGRADGWMPRGSLRGRIVALERGGRLRSPHGLDAVALSLMGGALRHLRARLRAPSSGGRSSG